MFLKHKTVNRILPTSSFFLILTCSQKVGGAVGQPHYYLNFLYVLEYDCCEKKCVWGSNPDGTCLHSIIISVVNFEEKKIINTGKTLAKYFKAYKTQNSIL